ncbi:MAG TPA: adenylate/guanylate cyclase domain-containing protein [Acidimicrobiales bacterium]|nr:adenylate/guanylate cyclase domain-containing protein [Acidimicrobiales bacterium]
MADGAVRGTASAPDTPPDERRHLTVVFSDLVGSTELASRMDAEDVREVIDAYQHRVAEVVSEHGGVIAQFQGDGAVAYFGYPEAIESAGRDAVAAALAIVQAVQQLGHDLPPELGVSDLSARAGVHTGEVVVGPTRAGGVLRIADVFGEAPNLAARLQSAGGPGDVIVSDTTASIVSGYFVMQAIGALSLKGIARQVPSFRVIRRSAARRRLETGPLTGFVQRPRASAWLTAHWESVVEGPARAVLVTGEPGIGKSRLLQEFTGGLAGNGVHVSPLYCARRDALSPLRPFGPVMGHVPLSPEVAADWVLSRAHEGPMVLLVEDAHWADPSTIEVVDQVVHGAYPLLAVLTARPEFVDDPPLQTVDQLSLERLSAEEAMSIVSRVPGGDQLPSAMARALVERGDGVPLFLEELTRAVVNHSSDPDAITGIPATLSEVITARLDRLGEAKRIAQLAAIVGRAFDRRVLQAVSGLDRPSLDAHLQHLVDHAVVEPSDEGDGHWWFRHALIHEAAYGSVLRVDRRRAHAQVADILLLDGRGEVQPEVVAFHLGIAGRAAEAVEHWRHAARAARRHARFREAAGHERELLALVPHLPESEQELAEMGARSRLTLCLTAVDQSSPEAIVEGMRVQELARRTGDRKALLRSFLVLLPWWQANADYRSIDDALPEAERLAFELEDPWAQQTLARYAGAVRIWQGRAPEGVRLLDASFEASGPPLGESLAAQLPSGLPVLDIVTASTRIAAALGCWLCGRVTDANRIREDTLRFAAERSVPQAQAVTGATAAIIAQLDGDRVLVSSLTGDLAQMGDEVTTRQWQQWASVLQWWSGASTSEPEVPGPLLRPYFLTLMADRDAVPTDRALTLLDDALDTARATGELFCEAEILRVRGTVLRRAGHIAAADALFDESAAVARTQGAPILELRALTERAGLPGARPETRTALADAVKAFANEDPTHAVARAVAVLEGA